MHSHQRFYVLGQVLQMKHFMSDVSAERFREVIREEAWKLYVEREPLRKEGDWWQACHEIVGYDFVSQDHPQFSVVAKRARELWLTRKDHSTWQDWVDAEGYVVTRYRIAS